MRAIALTPGTTTVQLVDRPAPALGAPYDVTLRVLQVGICGTDREEADGGRARAPDGATELGIGHEMVGQVVEVGTSVTRVQPGDYAVFTVRRGCGTCAPCAVNRADYCETGTYRERGIWGLDGFQAEFVVDQERYVVRVPPEIASVGVLTEPLSVAEKAIDEAIHTQTGRLPTGGVAPNWLFGRRCLVAGLGPIGLLAALALRLRGADVFGLDVVDAGSARPSWLAAIGGSYIDGRQIAADTIDDAIGPMDLILEATGIAALEFNLLDALALNGVYVLTGIPGGDRPISIPGTDLIRQLVLGNLAMVGSVNASRDHFQMAVDDLASAHLRWGDHVNKLITNRYPAVAFDTALHTHTPDDIKTVIDWTI